MSRSNDTDESRLTGDPPGQGGGDRDARGPLPFEDTGAEPLDRLGEGEDPLVSEVQPPTEGKAHLWFIGAALVTAIALVLIVAFSGIYDPYRCQTNDQCRGVNRCIDGRCRVPEIWMNEVDRACRQALGLERSCFSAEAWEEID